MIIMGNATVPSSSVVPIFTLPSGLSNFTLYQPTQAQMVYVGPTKPVTRGQVSSLGQATAATSVTALFPAGVQAGNTILALVQCSAGTPTSVADNGSPVSTFTLDASTAAGHGVYIYRANGIAPPAGAAYQVTANYTTSTTTLQIGGVEYSGVKPGSPDTTHTASATSTAVATGAVAPNSPGVVIGGFSDASALNPETITFTGAAPAVQQLINANGSAWPPFAIADSLTGASQNLTWTLGDSVAWGAAVAAYSPAAGLTSANGMPIVNTPVNEETYVGGKNGMTFYATTGNATASSLNFLISTAGG
jgi:hypothetical protein